MSLLIDIFFQRQFRMSDLLTKKA